MKDEMLTIEIQGQTFEISLLEAVMIRNRLTQQIIEMQMPVAKSVNFFEAK